MNSCPHMRAATAFSTTNFPVKLRVVPITMGLVVLDRQKAEREDKPVGGAR